MGPTVNSVYKQVLFNNCENCPPSSDLVRDPCHAISHHRGTWGSHLAPESYHLPGTYPDIPGSFLPEETEGGVRG